MSKKGDEQAPATSRRMERREVNVTMIGNISTWTEMVCAESRPSIHPLEQCYGRGITFPVEMFLGFARDVGPVIS